MKNCNRCDTNKELTEFGKNSRYSLGVKSWCKECCKEYNRTNKCAQKWTENNRSRSNAIKVEYVKNNINKVRLSKNKWSKANPGKELAKTRKYQASKIQATPSWLTTEQIKEIEKIYINRPKGYHVDHIVPLKGKTVRGLHVPWNLQYLPARVNQRKSSKY